MNRVLLFPHIYGARKRESSSSMADRLKKYELFLEEERASRAAHVFPGNLELELQSAVRSVRAMLMERGYRQW